MLEKGKTPVAGVTSLSLATVAVHAPQAGTSYKHDSPRLCPVGPHAAAHAVRPRAPAFLRTIARAAFTPYRDSFF